MTPIKSSVRITAVIVSAAYSVVLFLSGIELDTLDKKVLALLPGGLALMVVAYDRWVWRWMPVQRLHHRPRIDGLWKAALRPSAESHIPEGGNRGPIESYIIVEQTFWSLSVIQFTIESESYSRTSTFIKHGESSIRTLSFLYDNAPRLQHRKRSPRHVGACELRTSIGAPTTLEGSYFTDRYTQGEMSLRLVDRSINFADFASAKAHADAHQD